jgi:hypothetical protein
MSPKYFFHFTGVIQAGSARVTSFSWKLTVTTSFLLIFQSLFTNVFTNPTPELAMASRKLSNLFIGIPFFHTSLTLASVGLGIYGGDTDSKETFQEESFDAKHYDLVTEFVTGMYSFGKVLHPHCLLSPTIGFEDPVAVVKSPEELSLLFRALRKLQPRSLAPPKCIHVEPLGSSIQLTYALHQHYALLDLELKSHLIIDVELQQRQDVPESDFLVSRIEERWNGRKTSTSNPLLWITKRINGILSYHFTKRAILDEK